MTITNLPIVGTLLGAIDQTSQRFLRQLFTRIELGAERWTFDPWPVVAEETEAA